MNIREQLASCCFQAVHRTNLVYNTCWEDPRLDRVALQLGPGDRVLTITSAGCNTLDYALLQPDEIHAVDLNRRQNALLELKLAGIRRLDYGTFFSMFGRGQLRDAREVYRDLLRPELPAFASAYWDRRMGYFSGSDWRQSFYFRGSSGTFARLVNGYLDRVARARDAVEAILLAPTVAEQREIYDRQLRDAFWGRTIRWAIGRDLTLSLLGVPQPQRQQVERDYQGGVAGFIEDCVEAVFAQLPLRDNYFWRVYLTGGYTQECCPEYLKPDNFALLKGGLVDRVSTFNGSVTEFLRAHPRTLTRFVLLDHMDWLSTRRNSWLQEEWQAIVDRAAPGARIIWRSGGLRTDFVDRLPVQIGGRPQLVGDVLSYQRELSAELHARDRVHTYGSFWIADLACG